MRSATTATASMVMGAAAPARKRTAGLALRQTAINQHASQSAETARRLVRRDATMAAPCRATGARQLAQSSAASVAPGAARPLRTRANRPAATERRLRMRSATTATASMVMGAAAPARKRTAGLALRTDCAQSACNTVCGDGKRAGIEECDDGGSVPGDGCSAACTVECGFNCTGGSPTTADTCQSSCGDGELASDEACDDGNSVNGDGCSTSCTIETGISSAILPQVDAANPLAHGSRAMSIAETGALLVPNLRDPFFCDDGNTFAVDGCSATCTVECGFDCSGGTATTADRCSPTCGDGIPTASEECDDGNTLDDDGCSANCTKEAGYNCTTPACDRSTCSTVCGDGYRAGSEGCDDGGSVPGDGCSATCAVECGFNCTGGSPTAPDTCTSPCGDGELASDEDCDDGNTLDDDGCSGCSINAGWTCSPNPCGISLCTPPTSSSTPTPTTFHQTTIATTSSITDAYTTSASGGGTTSTTPSPALQACRMKGQALQTNPHPCAKNKIYFSFAANVTLYKGIDISVVGLCDTLTPDDDAIEVNEIQNNDLLPAGKWNQTSCTLKLTLGAHVDADKWIEFWVELRNPTENSENTCSTGRLLHTASTLRVGASAVCTNQYALTNDQNQVDLR
jgi:cysteine-rich repeat protein